MPNSLPFSSSNSNQLVSTLFDAATQALYNCFGSKYMQDFASTSEAYMLNLRSLFSSYIHKEASI